MLSGVFGYLVSWKLWSFSLTVEEIPVWYFVSLEDA